MIDPPLMADRVKFNVGGRVFETTSTTLANAGRSSFFGAMLDDHWNLPPRHHDRHHFIDRNPDTFAVLLDLLRTGLLSLPPNVPQKLLYKDAEYYGLLDLLRAATWGPIDGNRLSLAHSVMGRAPGDATAIRASPLGGCCVAHGCTAHVYDWTLRENYPPINLDYQIINDVCWVDPVSILVSACERLGRADGGMGLFNAVSGELRQKLQISHDSRAKSYTAGALSHSAENGKIFASCKGRSNEYGVGVWDEETGQQVDFFYEPLGWSLGDADRLQWLGGSSCLLAATFYPRKDNCYISLLDFRCKEMVWAWSDVGAADEKRVRDAIAMEGGDAICVVNEYEDLGFLDVRGTGGGVRWSSRSRLMSGRAKAVEDEVCYPKLAVHEGQLFSSMSSCVSVFSGPDWVLTSRLRRGRGGSICDFSIGGDRLFALHSEENVFDVWETPPPN